MNEVYNLEHLFELANRGRQGGSGGAEKQARRIVRCLLDDVIGLDASASAGIADLIAIVQRSPQSGREAIRNAAGIRSTRDQPCH